MLLQLRQRVTVAAHVLVCCFHTLQLYAPAAAIAALFAVCVELESELKKNVWLLTIMVTDTAMHLKHGTDKYATRQQTNACYKHHHEEANRDNKAITNQSWEQ